MCLSKPAVLHISLVSLALYFSLQLSLAFVVGSCVCVLFEFLGVAGLVLASPRNTCIHTATGIRIWRVNHSYLYFHLLSHVVRCTSTYRWCLACYSNLTMSFPHRNTPAPRSCSFVINCLLYCDKKMIVDTGSY